MTGSRAGYSSGRRRTSCHSVGRAGGGSAAHGLACRGRGARGYRGGGGGGSLRGLLCLMGLLEARRAGAPPSLPPPPPPPPPRVAAHGSSPHPAAAPSERPELITRRGRCAQASRSPLGVRTPPSPSRHALTETESASLSSAATAPPPPSAARTDGHGVRAAPPLLHPAAAPLVPPLWSPVRPQRRAPLWPRLGLGAATVRGRPFRRLRRRRGTPVAPPALIDCTRAVGDRCRAALVPRVQGRARARRLLRRGARAATIAARGRRRRHQRRVRGLAGGDRRVVEVKGDVARVEPPLDRPVVRAEPMEVHRDERHRRAARQVVTAPADVDHRSMDGGGRAAARHRSVGGAEPTAPPVPPPPPPSRYRLRSSRTRSPL